MDLPDDALVAMLLLARAALAFASRSAPRQHGCGTLESECATFRLCCITIADNRQQELEFRPMIATANRRLVTSAEVGSSGSDRCGTQL